LKRIAPKPAKKKFSSRGISFRKPFGKTLNQMRNFRCGGTAGQESIFGESGEFLRKNINCIYPGLAIPKRESGRIHLTLPPISFIKHQPFKQKDGGENG
jgi:hypothetical protein